ncbi:hypothetical protein RHGRI_034359 [Rhododendron griersonianum]|uniref:Uncharacterized protein n=1 Tax=Rhododendron griersonianum TaxID=479676 RepID=A0AAV6I4Y4_9ERIC|nr:hypothetical protein RHGRI_034359 [Rhododendron griersonianum]
MKDYVLSKGRLNSTPKLTRLLSFTRFVPVVLVRYLIERYSTSQIRSFTLFWQCENAGSPGTPSMHSSAVSAADTAVLDALSLLCHCKMT